MVVRRLVAVALAGVHPHEEFLIGKRVGVLGEGLYVVEGHVHAAIEGVGVFVGGREVGLEEDPRRIKVGHGVEDAVQFAG